MKIFDSHDHKELIYIIQPILNDDYKQLQEEAVSLIDSAGALYAGTIYQKIRKINPVTFIGYGKLSELRERLTDLNITVLFNGDLSPSQVLNISSALNGLKVIDRTTLILDIFAKNAKSNEGRLQVELAQLKYLYPRLQGNSEKLSRLGGGIGTRGPGETKLETDRRRIRERIDFLETKLLTIENRRRLIATRRKKCAIKNISLVGYTNTGKSTLLNLLTNSDVYTQNRLFATLDTTSRKLILDDQLFILTDTVGFLRDLPHNLISAFHSTLESALNCDLLLIVCDAMSDYEMQLQTTLQTLKVLNCQVPYKIVINKSENVQNFDSFPSNSIFVSAKSGKGIEGLKNEILKFFEKQFSLLKLNVAYSNLGEYNKLKKYLTELNTEFTDKGVLITIKTETRHITKFNRFLT